MLILKPCGRGNWSPLRVTFEGKHAASLGLMLAGLDSLGLRVGQVLQLGGVRWRVCEVRP